MRFILFILISFFSVGLFSQGYPVIKSNGLKPTDKVFSESIDSSKEGELTIVSFNIRDVQGRTRSLLDFQELADMVDEADIVVFQELGAKGFSSSGNNGDINKRIDAMIAVYQVYLGENWAFEKANVPTPEELGGGAELPFVAYKKESNGMSINISWDRYEDLGNRRDMGVFKAECTKGNQSESFEIGSVHTKPTAPVRGEELLKIGEFAKDHKDDKFILLGDFNWGYKSSGSEGYKGEKYIQELHDDGIVFQVFYHLSYNGNGKKKDFRTNLQRRKSAHLYDQFLLCNAYANKMADGGRLTHDCGFLTFSTSNHFKKTMKNEVKTQMKGVKVALKETGVDLNDPAVKEQLDEIEEDIMNNYRTVDVGSYRLSDHKPIWLQLKLF